MMFVLPVGEVGDEHAGDRVAADGPVPQLLSGPQRDRLLVARVNGDVVQACVDQPLPQDVGVGDLELKERLVLGGASNSGTTACAALMKTCRASNSAGFP